MTFLHMSACFFLENVSWWFKFKTLNVFILILFFVLVYISIDNPETHNYKHNFYFFNYFNVFILTTNSQLYLYIYRWKVRLCCNIFFSKRLICIKMVSIKTSRQKMQLTVKTGQITERISKTRIHAFKKLSIFGWSSPNIYRLRAWK